MGVRCVKGPGEAEATCAILNSKGVNIPIRPYLIFFSGKIMKYKETVKL